jgi:Lipopolysaccharide assembly protein A domain
MTRPLLALLMILAAAVLVAFAIANRTLVTVSLDPFEPTDPAFRVTMPLWVLGFAVLILGVALGGIVSWFSQGKWRRHRRRLEMELARVRAEFDRAKREALREMRGAPPPQGSLPVARLPAN